MPSNHWMLKQTQNGVQQVSHPIFQVQSSYSFAHFLQRISTQSFRISLKYALSYFQRPLKALSLSRMFQIFCETWLCCHGWVEYCSNYWKTFETTKIENRGFYLCPMLKFSPRFLSSLPDGDYLFPPDSIFSKTFSSNSRRGEWVNMILVLIMIQL